MFSDFSFSYSQKFAAYSNENLDTNHEEIYNTTVQKFYDELDLPALWLDESGFSKGNADEQEILEVVKSINKESLNADNVMGFLDQELMSRLEVAYDAELERLEEEFKERVSLRKEFEAEQHKNSYNY